MKVIWCSEQESNGKVLNGCRLFLDKEWAMRRIEEEMKLQGYKSVDISGNVDDKKMITFLSPHKDNIVHWFFVPMETE